MVDIATRVWNHKWKIDPIVRSLIDTDFYKLLMCQSVFRNHPDTQVTFSLINRTKTIRLADLVDEGELREQLDHIRSLRLTRGESTWLRGNTFYGKRQMFTPAFMEWFEKLELPPYHLEKKDGQYELTFEGTWPEVMLWEIPALAVIMELRSRAVLKDMGKFELQVLYARAMTKLWEKVDRLKGIPDLRVADFGTRRRHSYLWQDWCVQAMMEGLGQSFTGTSNCRIAMMREIEAIGTNAHELPMVYAALAETDDALRQSPYDVLADWHEEHDGNLRIILPDTYGTKRFLEGAPDWLAGWTGIRVDSGDPATGAETAINWWLSRGEDPREKLVIFSDGLDADKIVELHQQFVGRCRVSFGWGTMLTNDFKGLVAGDALAPFSLVCKAVSANGRPTVKLSDNPKKAMGPQEEIARYKQVFDVGAQDAIDVVV
ncbi:nicotinate phosphoribosyltransferase [Roseobacter sp. CCS2]|uniref:nicotinate phosphoribosyltransferase n=1 Tax=Roseobacter sp. CCS2 TaxID=391593 RepID=UPI0000F40281|nr:nicotinate phosphoribosyltransferase [Roseobacter sp. CCS2]EBA13798.1 nicotinate phosphoribosyltransferase [Roseobacter sp. CCS2]